MSWSQKGNSEHMGVGAEGAEAGVSILETTELCLLSSYCVADLSQVLYILYPVSYSQHGKGGGRWVGAQRG